MTEEISTNEIALFVKVFCTTRTASRDFHKLLETTILMRLNDLKQDMKIMHQIGYNFELSGLCSMDTLKAFKKVYGWSMDTALRSEGRAYYEAYLANDGDKLYEAGITIGNACEGVPNP